MNLFPKRNHIVVTSRDLEEISFTTGWVDVDGVHQHFYAYRRHQDELIGILNDKLKRKEELPTFLGIHPKFDETIGLVLNGKKTRILLAK